MKDPLPPPPHFLTALVEPFASSLGLQTLPLHIHTVLLAFSFYVATQFYISPWISRMLIPRRYAAFNTRTRINWDVHVVSFVQSVLVCVLALWVILTDDERKAMGPQERVWGYTGASGMIQGMAAGYFMWDLMVCILHIKIFGVGMLMHAISAISVFSFGFRPFVNFYTPTFILYELSSPFLNIHWFCDKLDLTGSMTQLINGIILLTTFFLCRLCWGTYQSVRVYQDVWAALQSPPVTAFNATTATDSDGQSIMRFIDHKNGTMVPVWLADIYLGSNVVLNSLNWYWYGKMIETIRKRFRPKEEKPEKTDGIIKDEGKSTDGLLAEGASVSKEKGRSGEVITVHTTQVRRRKPAEEDLPVAFT